MKKILALVLAAMMILAAVSALAADSKGNTDISGGTIDAAEVSMKKIDDTAETKAIKDAITAANEAGNALDGVPADVKGQIPEANTVINEMDTYQLEGYTDEIKEATLTFTFETPYVNKDITVLIGIAPAGAEVEWLVLEGKGQENGDVVVKVTEEELKKISNNPFVAIPVSPAE